MIQTTKQDGSISSVSYDQATPGVAGVCTVSTDEAGKLRRACSDALGRLVEVDEPNPGAQATYAQASVSIGGSEQANPQSGSSGSLTDEYVFFDGERVARKSTNGVFYYFSDHLKTASVITDASGNIKSESDFYPLGRRTPVCQ